MKYKDVKLEQEYFDTQFYQSFRLFGKLYLIAMGLVSLVFMMFQVYFLIILPEHPTFKYAMMFGAGIIVFSAIPYLICLKLKFLVSYYANIQFVLCIVLLTELALYANPNAAATDGFIVVTLLLSINSLMTYNQINVVLFMLTYLVYEWYRTKHWFAEPKNWMRYNIYLLLCTIILYIVSRTFNARERSKFESNRHEKDLIKMFNKVLKIFHDGIVIVHDGQVVYENDFISEIFTSNLKYEQDQNNLVSEPQTGSQSCFYHIKTALMNSKLRQNNNGQLESWEQGGQKFENLWQYLQLQEKEFDSSKLKAHKKHLDGYYFLYEDEDMNVSKQIQVFSQIIQIGNSKMVMATVRDMSTWIELERQKNISQMKTVAFAQAAHEFRNPLNGIVQSLDLMGNSIDSSNQYYQVARNCTSLMLFLVNDILDYSQYESKSLLLNQENVNIRQIVSDCKSMMYFQAKLKELEMIIEFDSDFPEIIVTDQNRVRQILINLISNSIKYTQRGYVKIKAIVIDHYQYMLQVKDTGVGIDQKNIPDLFKRFTKISTDRELNKLGCGLGLTLSKNIANALGGDILVASEKGKGSTFSLILKAQQPIEDPFRNMQFPISRQTSRLSLSKIDIYERKDSKPILGSQAQDSEYAISENYDSPPMYQKFDALNGFTSPRLNNKKFIKSTFSLPLKKIQEQSEELEELQSQRIECQCIKVMIADDEPFNIMALKGILKQLKVKSDSAYDGQQLIEKLQSENVCPLHNLDVKSKLKLVIMDNQMPILSGVEAAQQIRQMMQQATCLSENLQIALCTGDLAQIRQQSNLESELFDYYLEKPIVSQDLKQLLSNLSII